MSEAMAEAKAMSEAMSGEGASGSAYLGPQLTMPAPPPDVNPDLDGSSGIGTADTRDPLAQLKPMGEAQKAALEAEIVSRREAIAEGKALPGDASGGKKLQDKEEEEAAARAKELSDLAAAVDAKSAPGWGEAERAALATLLLKMSDGRRRVRIAAVEAVAGLTATDSGRLQLASTDAAEVLCGLLDDRHVARDATAALTNMCCARGESDDRVAQLIVDYGALPMLVAAALDPEWAAQEQTVMLLANLCVSERAATALMQVEEDEGTLAGVWLRDLATAFAATGDLATAALVGPAGIFVGGSAQGGGSGGGDDELEASDTAALAKLEDEQKLARDPLQYVGYLLANVSKVEAGRQLLMRCAGDSLGPCELAEGEAGDAAAAGTCILSMVLSQLAAGAAVRRRGVAALLRNCCFEWNRQLWLLDSAKILTPLLMRLVDKADEFDDDDLEGMDPALYTGLEERSREPEAPIRKALVESLTLLCWRHRAPRTRVRDAQTYPIIRNMHLEEESDAVGTLIYELVEYLIRDEEGDEPDWDQIKADSLAIGSAETAAAAKSAAAKAAAAAEQPEEEEEELDDTSAQMGELD
jgi:hypothetical protein